MALLWLATKTVRKKSRSKLFPSQFSKPLLRQDLLSQLFRGRQPPSLTFESEITRTCLGVQLAKTRKIILLTDSRWQVAAMLLRSQSPQVACYHPSVKSRITAVRTCSQPSKVKLLPTEVKERKLKRLSALKIHQSELKLSSILGHPLPRPMRRSSPV